MITALVILLVIGAVFGARAVEWTIGAVLAAIVVAVLGFGGILLAATAVSGVGMALDATTSTDFHGDKAIEERKKKEYRKKHGLDETGKRVAPKAAPKAATGWQQGTHGVYAHTSDSDYRVWVFCNGKFQAQNLTVKHTQTYHKVNMVVDGRTVGHWKDAVSTEYSGTQWTALQFPYLSDLKKGLKMTLSLKTEGGMGPVFSTSLIGFTKAYDSVCK